jgi:glutathione S-transferase
MDELTLYTHPQSRGRIARWMLEETGLPYRTVVLDYGTTMKGPEYLAMNPMGKVPCVTLGRTVVTEGAAICTRLADAFPDTGLMPEDRASFYRWMFFTAGPFEAAITDKALGVDVSPKQSGFVGYGSLQRTIATLEHLVTDRRFVIGDRFSAADVYIGSQIGYGLLYGSLPDRPAFTAYWNGLKDRPARQRATAADDALLPKEPT